MLDLENICKVLELKYLGFFWFVIFVIYIANYHLKLSCTFFDYVLFSPYIITGLLDEVGVPHLLNKSPITKDVYAGLGFYRPSTLGYTTAFLFVNAVLLGLKFIWGLVSRFIYPIFNF